MTRSGSSCPGAGLTWSCTCRRSSWWDRCALPAVHLKRLQYKLDAPRTTRSVCSTTPAQHAHAVCSLYNPICTPPPPPLQAQDFRIQYDSIVRIFLLPKVNAPQTMVVISLDPPIRWGQHDPPPAPALSAAPAPSTASAPPPPHHGMALLTNRHQRSGCRLGRPLATLYPLPLPPLRAQHATPSKRAAI